MTADFSVVIPSRSRADLLESCLDSVHSHAPAGTPVIVVDDGSRNAIISHTARQFEGVTVIRHDKSRGFCAAANSGMRTASTPFVELLNDDAEVTPGWYIEPIRLLKLHDTAAVNPLILQYDSRRIDSAGDHYDEGGFASKRQKMHNDTELSSVSGCATFYRRDAVLAAGGFPEEFGAYFDDVDLSQRMRRAGHRLTFAPSSVVLHHGSASHRRCRRLIEQQSRNEEWLYWRNAGTYRTLPRHIVVLCGKALRRIEEGTLGPWLSGRVRAIMMIPR